MLVKLNYRINVVNFVATYIVTIGSYCFSNSNKYIFGYDIISKIYGRQKNYINNAIILRNPLVEIWNETLNCDFTSGLDKFKTELAKNNR